MKNYKSIFTAIVALVIVSCTSEETFEQEKIETFNREIVIAKSKTLDDLPPCKTPVFTSPITVTYDCTPIWGESSASRIILNYGTVDVFAPITMVVEIQEYVQDCDSNAPDEPTIPYYGEFHSFEYTPLEYNGGSLIIGNTSIYDSLGLGMDLLTERCFAWRIGFYRFIDGEKCGGFKGWHFETFKTHCD